MSLFSQLSRYNEYIVGFITMQQQGNYAPIAAYEKPNGEITGFLYLAGESGYSLSTGDVIWKMEHQFEDWLSNDTIKSYVFLYHSQFNNDGNHQVADNNQAGTAISIAYHFKNEDPGTIGLPYQFENEEIVYQAFAEFSEQENHVIFNTTLKPDWNYFQHTETVATPETENEIGLRIKKSNNADLSNTWGGVFGFDTYQQEAGRKLLQECFALTLMKGTHTTEGEITVSSLQHGDVSFTVISEDGQPRSILPVVTTSYVAAVESKEINEWENTDNLEAVITGTGKQTFGISYLATDYALNREQYLSQKKHDVKLSGIVFVLDVSSIKNDEETTFADDFVAYMPSKQFANYACFDFIGLLEDFKETTLLPDSALKGFLLKVRLINHPDIQDFFTIDLFVSPENMRFTELTKGMKLSGMFQLQGRLAQ